MIYLRLFHATWNGKTTWKLLDKHLIKCWNFSIQNATKTKAWKTPKLTILTHPRPTPSTWTPPPSLPKAGPRFEQKIPLARTFFIREKFGKQNRHLRKCWKNWKFWMIQMRETWISQPPKENCFNWWLMYLRRQRSVVECPNWIEDTSELQNSDNFISWSLPS